MKVLGTKDAKKRYISEIKRIDVVQEMQLMTWTFCLSTELWEKYSERKSSVNLVELKKIKYFNNDYILSDVNTIELLIEAEKRYSQSNITEMENAYYKEFFKKEETINNDSEDMKLYLDDPERVINMIKVRHRINC